jgi:hypothetical protein
MLPRIVALHDVPDVEWLCRGAVAEVLRRFGPPDATETDFEYLLGFALGEVHIIDSGDPVTGRRGFDTGCGVPFRLYAYGTLRHRLVDEMRSPRLYGRHGQGRVHGELPGEGGSAGAAGAPPAGGEHALPWLAAEGDGDRAGDGQVLDLGPRPGAPRVGDRPGRRPTPNPWIDCESCGWRNYRRRTNGDGSWDDPERCGSCGAEFPTELERPAGDGDRRDLAA